ncbi:hypothetical protein P168DRAFT_263476 [Aspergillus campestris IBT 28561]|uniref:Uncharacterized protein n=1 Tax=Aspergillus campestris (strain IBT 28561) TaxID=1392248 RepID=A0A2I1DGS3_ASPC2|nr:uncharacterized protein P168DRAFT_263476 [Aspergillus campestris IBT 28561]PKY09073.1 hypothetical protein P168DRAFT_263476 [Aspergillus campestris IBT 28561]
MSSTTDPEGKGDVNDFLLRIRELGQKRDKEDEQRTKKLEEEILQGRRERQARRAERARSLSPTKDSPPLFDPARMSMSALGQRAIDPPQQLEPTPRTPEHITPPRPASVRGDEFPSPSASRRGSTVEATSSLETSPRPASPSLRSRTGTLSWQQRPASRDLHTNRSLFSTSPTRTNRLRTMSTASNNDTGIPPNLSASSPSSKDTRSPPRPDTIGLTSPPREGSKEDQHHGSPSGASTKATAMDREKTPEPTKESAQQENLDERSRSPSRASSIFAESSQGQRYSSVSSVSTATGLGSPVPLSNAQKFEPPQTEPASEEQTMGPPSPRRMSPERSTSPTKGLGGFVQSAMMKRSDSVSKRWSAQLPSGLSRADPFASNRNSFAAPTGTDVLSLSPTSKAAREGSLLPSHRPGSSHSEATVVRPMNDSERPVTPPVPGSVTGTRADESPRRAPLSLHTRPGSSLGSEVNSESNPPSSSNPAASRTMDPKRWSPTKSTWLESALNRPDSPRHKKSPSQQATWSPSRQSRGSTDLGRVNSFKEVTPVGLMRTAAPGRHSKKSSVSGIPDVFALKPTLEPALESTSDSASKSTSDPALKSTSDPASKLVSDPASKAATDEKANVPTPTERPSELPVENKDSVPRAEETDTTGRKEITRKRAPSVLAPVPRTDSELPLSTSRDPLLNRPKPQSPVIDFRANLKRREVVKDDSPRAEPEFKNVFGRLRKAESSTYAAPDELKDNILKGKAGLNNSGGPRKTQRVDELKESLNKQKEAMKSGGGSTRRSTVGQDDAPAKIVVPEAIAKRQNLAKSNSDKTNEHGAALSPQSPRETGTSSGSPDPPFSALSPLSPQPDEFGESLRSPEIPTSGTDEDRSQGASPAKEEEGTKRDLVDATPKPEPAGDTQIKQDISTEETMKPVRDLPSGSVAQAADTPAAAAAPPTKGKLAGRLNPALAGLLSRGPPQVGAMNTSSSLNATSSETGSSKSEPATLTHITKSRARGPKRRLPKTVVPEAAAPEAPTSPSKEVPPKDETTPTSSFDIQRSETSPSPVEEPMPNSSNWPLPDKVLDTHATAPDSHASQPTQHRISKPTEFKRSLPRLSENQIKLPLESVSSDPPTEAAKAPHDPGTVRGDLGNTRETPSNRSSLMSRMAASPSTPPVGQARSSQIHYSSPSPSPLRTSLNGNQAPPPPTPPKIWSGIPFMSSRETSPKHKSLPSPPVPRKSSSPSVDQSASPRSSGSLVPQADESLAAISSFFNTFPNSSDRVNIDPQLMLASRGETDRIRTLKMQIWEITGDGRKQDLPVNQEYILYEGSMYLCVHVFEDETSQRSEAQLWCGDGVPDSAIDDAQSFSRKVAKENWCKLEVIKQGKEPARFIQALGGILITRRGSSSRSSSSAIFMLCGRKHLGQMVFDEVDFSRRNLCSGYPFVISSMFGKLFLWKGLGSSAEEVGAARLIGMDLGLTGEFEEVTEGEEPESFSEAFPLSDDQGDYMKSDHWKLKPHHSHFQARLFRVDHELGQRSGFWIRRSGSNSPIIRPNDTVQEVEVFCQKDISAKGIYVLDTFFEIYVIVGEQASKRPAEFASAVVFAHEYGILAASLQDRPFIPKSYVSLGGVPESCRSALRKWDGDASRPAPQVFPLNAAIEAIRSS